MRKMIKFYALYELQQKKGDGIETESRTGYRVRRIDCCEDSKV